MPALAHWLASRQFIYLNPPENEDGEPDEDPVNFTLPDLAQLSLEEHQHLAGFNGRCNKVADTCYTWWVGAALFTLGQEHLISQEASRRFLLEKMQHRIGGFGKYPGSPPDLYHGCFGLAILAVMGEEGLNKLDSSLAVPIETVRRIERARKDLLEAERADSKARQLEKKVVGMGLGLAGKKPNWLTGSAI